MKIRVSAGAVALLAFASMGASWAQDADQFSSIASSQSTHAIGTAYDAASQEEAEAAALARCAIHADDCENRNWSRNACSALAIDIKGEGGWGAAWGSTYQEAADGAHATCMEFNDGCQIYAWVCNSTAAPQ